MASADDHPRPSGNALQSAPKAVPTAPPHSSQPRTALASSFGPYCSMPATRRFAVSLFEPLAIRLLQLTKQRRIRKDYFRASLANRREERVEHLIEFFGRVHLHPVTGALDPPVRHARHQILQIVRRVAAR